MFKLRIVLSLFGALLSVTVLAQFDKKSEFEAFRNQKRAEFSDYRTEQYRKFEQYRKQKNEEFAAYARQKWDLFEVLPGRKKHTEPKPVVPPVVLPKEDVAPVEPSPLPHGEILPDKKPVKPVPIVVPEVPKGDKGEPKKINVIFFGTGCSISVTDELKFRLASCTEKDVADCLYKLASVNTGSFVADCSNLQRNMKLNGWATFKLCESVSRKVEDTQGNEAVLLQAWLMNQLGYDVRMARSASNRLLILCPFTMEAYTFAFLTIDGKTYYILDTNIKNEQIYTYRLNMKDAIRPIDFECPSEMVLSNIESEKRTVYSQRYPEVKVSVSVNKNLMDYYESEPYFCGYPWGFYARQPLSEDVGRQLMPPLRKALDGKTEYEKVSMLMDFLQYGFSYATDNEQFGYEKPFFFEENFYYPNNDCEDRSILLSLLVRKLVGLDVVLLYSPGHLWSAVNFHQEVSGDYVMVDNRKYVICDPTYTGARIGMTQPAYRGKQPVVIPL
ncbi:MAG: hypothetical protein IJP70_12020 [Bacteroidales bacterium]|nr:hypothetical protein [Bacteroidales bacterium]